MIEEKSIFSVFKFKELIMSMPVHINILLKELVIMSRFDLLVTNHQNSWFSKNSTNEQSCTLQTPILIRCYITNLDMPSSVENKLTLC